MHAQTRRALGIFLLALIHLLTSVVPTNADSGDIWYGYTHLWDSKSHLNVGDTVKTGDVIGQVGPIGESGYGNANHLHFMKTEVDPTTINSTNLYWIFEDPGGVDPIEGTNYPGHYPYGGNNPFDYLQTHTGNDFFADPGTNLLAVCDGTIVWWGDWPWDGTGSWMNTIWLKCDGGNTPSTGNQPGEEKTTLFQKISKFIADKVIQQKLQSLIAWFKNNEPDIKIKPIANPIPSPQVYQFSISEQYSNSNSQWNMKAFFAGFGQNDHGAQKVAELVQSGESLEDGLIIPAGKTISLNSTFGWANYEAGQGMIVAPGSNGADYGNGVCNVASMINMVLSKEGIQVSVDDNNHAPIPSVESTYWTVIYAPDPGEYAIAKDLRATNTFDYPVILNWKIDGDTISLWVEKDYVEETTPDSDNSLSTGWIWIVVILILIIMVLVAIFRPQPTVVGILWVSKLTPTILMVIKMSIKLAFEWWLFLTTTIILMQPILRAILSYGISRWLMSQTTVANWQIALIIVAFGLNVILRKYFYAKKIRSDGGYYIETPASRRGCISHFLVVMIALAIMISLTVLLVSASTTRAEESSPPNVDHEIGQCELTTNVPADVRQWCDLIVPNAQANGVDPTLVAAIIQVESGGDPNAISSCDAVGLMQVMPSDLTQKTIACGAISAKGKHVFSDRLSMAELRDPSINISEGTRILGNNLNYYGNYRDALKAYGPYGVGYSYADKVLGFFQAWTGNQNLSEGENG